MATANVENNKDIALISVSDKAGILEFARHIVSLGYDVIGSDGTVSYLRQNAVPAERIENITKASEMLNGRVKTLQRDIYAGILCRNTKEDEADMIINNCRKINIVVCILYPFHNVISKGCSISDAIENIDIGGVTLLRAAAKNFERVTAICDPADYGRVAKEILENGDTSKSTREELAIKVFSYITKYDDIIADYFRKQFSKNVSQISLRYGMNPHQLNAQIFTMEPRLPLKVVNGSPGYINICDALNAWQLVKEIKAALNLPAATSFKHVSPAGAAVGIPLSDNEKNLYMIPNGEDLSDLASAYARARGADRMSSFGDFIALSDVCDVTTAKIISREVSDGVIAPGFQKEALDLLRKKKNGSYCVLQIDPEYVPNSIERKILYGMTLEQERNNAVINNASFKNVVSENKQIPSSAMRDLILATITLKYTQSNSVCYAVGGQVIGIGAGQQSRIHCTRLAGDKADNWWCRQHPNIMNLKFKEKLSRADKANVIDTYIIDNDAVFEDWTSIFEVKPEVFSEETKKNWLKQLNNVSLASDGFFPFHDNVRRAYQSGVKYIASPAGSKNDAVVTEACNERNIVHIHTDVRLFHH